MKVCVDCSSDISGFHHNAIRCAVCKLASDRRRKAAYAARWRDANPEIHKELNQKNAQKYYKNNRELVLEKAKSRYAADPEPKKQMVRAWNLANPWSTFDVDKRRSLSITNYLRAKYKVKPSKELVSTMLVSKKIKELIKEKSNVNN